VTYPFYRGFDILTGSQALRGLPLGLSPQIADKDDSASGLSTAAKLPISLMIQHVTRQIPPAALPACVAFYSLLGFAEVQPPPGVAGRATWLERAGTQIHLMPTPEARPEAGHVAVVLDDYAAGLERLGATGHEVEPRREHWGSPRSYVRDPAGNLVELMAWAPGGRPAEPPSAV
jgi:catechol 2,3-dioxygenase-like lactoylglutathione lyase family enzyme